MPDTHLFPTLADQLLAQRRVSPVVLLSRQEVQAVVQRLLGLLFPHLSEVKLLSPESLTRELEQLAHRLETLITPLAPQLPAPLATLLPTFFSALPTLQAIMEADAQCMYAGDPAATSVDEVILAYPGFRAVAIYRLAHQLHQLGVPVIPRLMTEGAHQETGIDIHPGAQIGRSFCIDHGTGVVIGETAVIGDHVKIYQGVTLGALSVDKSMAQTQRHPTIGDRVVIYANATILGGDTVIGHDSTVGGNVWLTRSLPPHSVVYHRGQNRIFPVFPEEPEYYI
jgi:serine O-acetyltransferase